MKNQKNQMPDEEETREIMADKKLVESIRKAEKEFAEGKWFDWEDVKKELKINV